MGELFDAAAKLEITFAQYINRIKQITGSGGLVTDIESMRRASKGDQLGEAIINAIEVMKKNDVK